MFGWLRKLFKKKFPKRVTAPAKTVGRSSDMVEVKGSYVRIIGFGPIFPDPQNQPTSDEPTNVSKDPKAHST
jgi:hypothetical protein